MPKFLVVGEALIDVVHAPDGTVEEHPGGSPANVALGLGRLGQDVELATWISDDDRGQVISEHLADSHVAVTDASRGADATSVAIARLDDDGGASYEFDVNYRLPDLGSVEAYAYVHTGSIAAVDDDAYEVTVAALAAAKAAGAVVSYDPNLRPSLMGDVSVVRPRVERLVELADIAKVSEEDLAWLRPGEDIATVAAEWAKTCQFVVVTRGGDGVIALHHDGTEIDVPAQPSDVVDTVGAGDSYMSGLLDGIARMTGRETARDRLAGLGPATLRGILDRAAHIAAITVSRAGANPPWEDEV
ncbi:carbohydrate kinase family protein [Zhihengliuella salsuginis]|uniref:Ribokinase n=1 Tax=Zhihengliuella salsuginis TaxID=578222 RepID=A0ABQ3GFX9_9MICC|nr:carbohydrate kinase [Zhihengliuella salsuginis]GHD04765.1 ribokinase [Zhihengliuella salsuginis]